MARKEVFFVLMDPLHHAATPHILRLPQSAILAKVSPNTATGHTYTLTSEETKLTAERS
jgi:hypothetical protein